MKKYLLSFSVFSFCLPALSADLDAHKLDAAKRALCSKSTPCSISSKGYKETYVVKVNSVTITESGVIKINHYEYRRFIYKDGKFSHEVTNK